MLNIDFKSILFTVINLLVLFAALRIVFYKPVKKILEERQAMIDRDLSEAAEAKANAAALEQKRKDFLDGVEEERRLVLDNAQQKAVAEYDRIVASAQEEAESIVKTATVKAQNERETILQNTQAELADLVLTAAAKVIGMPSGADSALYDQFLKKAGENDDAGGN